MSGHWVRFVPGAGGFAAGDGKNPHWVIRNAHCARESLALIGFVSQHLVHESLALVVPESAAPRNIPITEAICPEESKDFVWDTVGRSSGVSTGTIVARP